LPLALELHLAPLWLSIGDAVSGPLAVPACTSSVSSGIRKEAGCSLSENKFLAAGDLVVNRSCVG